jgi:hypothetical protein
MLRNFVISIVVTSIVLFCALSLVDNYYRSEVVAKEKSEKYKNVEVISSEDVCSAGFYYVEIKILRIKTNNKEVLVTNVLFDKVYGRPKRGDKGKIVFSSNVIGHINKQFVPHDPLLVE